MVLIFSLTKNFSNQEEKDLSNIEEIFTISTIDLLKVENVREEWEGGEGPEADDKFKQKST